jgi:hypothetical protein
MTEYKTILPGAWELTEYEEKPLFVLKVPSSWRQVASSLAIQKGKRFGRRYSSIPVRSLNPIICASFPDIITTVFNGWNRPGNDWIYATDRADLTSLPMLIKDWLREEFSGCYEAEELESILDNLDDEAWQWEEEPLHYSFYGETNNEKEKDSRFQTIPYYLALQLSGKELCFGENNSYKLKFYRVINSTKGSELMSWPPIEIPLKEIKDKKEQLIGMVHISLVICFALQTVPWRKNPLVYHRLSVRRWIVDPLEKLPYGGMTTYIADNYRWLDGEKQEFCLISLPIKYSYISKENTWPKAIQELLELNDSLYDSSLPTPQDLIENPKYQWSSQEQGIQVAIAYDNKKFKNIKHYQMGVSSFDLASLDRAILEHLPVRRIGEGVKVKIPKKPKNSIQEYFWEKTAKIAYSWNIYFFKWTLKANFYGLARNIFSHLKRSPSSGISDVPMLRPTISAPATFQNPEHSPRNILILWKTEPCRDLLITTICELLSLSSCSLLDIRYQEIETGENVAFRLYEGEWGSIWIGIQHIGDLAARLNISPSTKQKERQKKRKTLLDERKTQITQSIPQAKELSGALVEIPNKDSFFPRESDPKMAVRIGVGQAGYINQHLYKVTGINKLGKEYSIRGSQERAKRAVSDLLRQFGIVPTPLIAPELDKIKEPIWLTCFYALRRTRKTTANNLPNTVALMLRVNSVTGIVEMTTPSLFENKRWVSYAVGLTKLLTEKWYSDSSEDSDSNEEEPIYSKKERDKEQEHIAYFVTNCLRDCLNTPIREEQLPRVLFMAEAHNSRKLLPWLQNPKLPANDLSSVLTLDREQEEHNRLWIVRLRVTDNNEVPVVIVNNQKSPGGRPSGLFVWKGVCDKNNMELYLSVRNALHTEKGQVTLKTQQSRLDDGNKLSGYRRLLEIAVIYHPEIDRETLAAFVHNLRDRWPYYANEIVLPFPFPFASKAHEYAVSTSDRIESEAIEEDE